MNGKRVVVTGLAAITPIGNDLRTSWDNLLAGVSGVKRVTCFDPEAHATKIAAEIKDFSPEGGVPPKLLKKLDRFCLVLLPAAKMLMDQCGLEITPEMEEDVGCILGCGLGGLATLEYSQTVLMESGPRRISPFMIPSLISNMGPGLIAIQHRTRGPNLVTTSACASGLHGIGYAYSEILLGRAKAMITGGVESTITALAVSGFNALKALSTRNDEPERASRPFDRDRDGFVMGEGAGVLLLEDLEHAQARGATIYAELAGFGSSCDANHMTAPDEHGRGMALAMRRALKEGGIPPEAVEHINAHATSTQLNDLFETRAIKEVFGSHAYKLSVTANKSMIGHCLGGAGGVESVFSVMSLNQGVLPPTINLDNPDAECDLDYLTDGPRRQQVEYVLCNNFGFGGTNACILFKRYP